MREAARLCRTSVWTLYRRINEGRLETFRAGGGRNFLISRESLDHFIAEHGIPAIVSGPTPDRRTRILIVDDDTEMCDMLERNFERQQGFDVAVATSGFTAGVQLATLVPDVILLDIQLGDMDGRELFAHMADAPRFKDVKVIAISGFIEPDEVSDLIDIGFHDYMAKPFRLTEITERVRALLAGVERRTELREKIQ